MKLTCIIQVIHLYIHLVPFTFLYSLYFCPIVLSIPLTIAVIRVPTSHRLVSKTSDLHFKNTNSTVPHFPRYSPPLILYLSRVCSRCSVPETMFSNRCSQKPENAIAMTKERCRIPADNSIQIEVIIIIIIIIIQLYFRPQPIDTYKYSTVEYTQLNMYTFQL